jgi:hypothetical protein
VAAPCICWQSDHASGVTAEPATTFFRTMAKPKRKLTVEQKKEKAQFMTIFIDGKQKRVRRPALIDGLDPEEFYLRNADPIALHGEGLWECEGQV